MQVRNIYGTGSVEKDQIFVHKYISGAWGGVVVKTLHC
jgi:hypothetical protein